MWESKPSWKERLALGRKFGRGMRSPLRWSLLGSVLVIRLIGTYFFSKAASLAERRGEIGGAASSSSDGTSEAAAADDGPWQVATSTDSMTDATLHEASATFEGAQFDAQVNVACSETGDISYTATSFDKDHKPAEMRSRTIPFGYTAGVYIDYQMRADNQPARSLSTGNPAYNNQIVLKSDAVGQSLQTDSSGIDLAESMAGASRVVLRLFMVSGEETFELPQGGKAFRDVVRPCLEQRQAKRQELTTERQQADAQTKATQIADVDRLYDDPSVDADTLVWMAKNRNVPVDEARLAQKRASERPKQLPLP